MFIDSGCLGQLLEASENGFALIFFDFHGFALEFMDSPSIFLGFHSISFDLH